MYLTSLKIISLSSFIIVQHLGLAKFFKPRRTCYSVLIRYYSPWHRGSHQTGRKRVPQGSNNPFPRVRFVSR